MNEELTTDDKLAELEALVPGYAVYLARIVYHAGIRLGISIGEGHVSEDEWDRRIDADIDAAIDELYDDECQDEDEEEEEDDAE